MPPDDTPGWQAEDAPRRRPLTYPGRWPERSVLVTRRAQRPLHLQPAQPLGQARIDRRAAPQPGGGPPGIEGSLRPTPHGVSGPARSTERTANESSSPARPTERTTHGPSSPARPTERTAHESSGPGGPPAHAARRSLDEVLTRLGAATCADRAPVLAVGSNAAPSQLRHKFAGSGTNLLTPMVLADIHGLASGVAADVSPVGYVPATPIVGPGLRSRLFVEWLDAAQLAVVDATEPGYRRVLIPAGEPAGVGVRITLPSGEILRACYAYVSSRGCLVDQQGTPLVLADQRTLLGGLLAASRRLRARLGDSPDAWIERTRRAGMVDAVREIFSVEGRVRHDPWLTALARDQDAPRGGPTPGHGEPTPVRSYGEIQAATTPPRRSTP